MKTKNDLWNLYEEIIRLRISDDKGYGYCDFCSAYENSTRLHIGIYVKKNFALWFDDQNVYICCDQCFWNIPEDRVKELRMKYKNIKIEYTKDDIDLTYWKLMRVLKNHIGWITKIQI